MLGGGAPPHLGYATNYRSSYLICISHVKIFLNVWDPLMDEFNLHKTITKVYMRVTWISAHGIFGPDFRPGPKNHRNFGPGPSLPH